MNAPFKLPVRSFRDGGGRMVLDADDREVLYVSGRDVDAVVGYVVAAINAHAELVAALKLLVHPALTHTPETWDAAIEVAREVLERAGGQGP